MSCSARRMNWRTRGRRRQSIDSRLSHTRQLPHLLVFQRSVDLLATAGNSSTKQREAGGETVIAVSWGLCPRRLHRHPPLLKPPTHADIGRRALLACGHRAKSDAMCQLTVGGFKSHVFDRSRTAHITAIATLVAESSTSSAAHWSCCRLVMRRLGMYEMGSCAGIRQIRMVYGASEAATTKVAKAFGLLGCSFHFFPLSFCFLPAQILISHHCFLPASHSQHTPRHAHSSVSLSLSKTHSPTHSPAPLPSADTAASTLNTATARFCAPIHLLHAHRQHSRSSPPRFAPSPPSHRLHSSHPTAPPSHSVLTRQFTSPRFLASPLRPT